MEQRISPIGWYASRDDPRSRQPLAAKNRPVLPRPAVVLGGTTLRISAHAARAGCIGLDDAANRDDYETKWRHVQRVLECELRRGATSILDAGCGTGLFTQRAAMLGFAKIDAIDFSASAAEIAQRNAPTSTVRVAALDKASCTAKYGVVMCIDVLFHIVDDATWARSVRNLAALTAPHGALVIQVSLSETDEAQPTRHVLYRSLRAYQQELPEWAVETHDTYVLPNEAVPKDLIVFKRSERPVD